VKIRGRSADLKAISFVVIIWVLAATVISFLAFIVIQTGMELAAADVLIAFIFVFFFWAVLVYVLTGEWPVHLSWIIPKKK
jgi:drug/metabolite transporter (DMT)-like permease